MRKSLHLKFIKSSLILILGVFLFQFSNAQTIHSNAKDGSIIFKLKDSYTHDYEIDQNNFVDLSSMKNMANLIDKYEVTQVTRELTAFNDAKLMRIFFVTFNEIQKVDEFTVELSKMNIVEYAELNYKREALWSPNDPYYTGNYKWYLTQIKAEQAWDIQRGVSSVKVAIVDNAVWGAHEDLLIAANNQCNATVNPVQTGAGKSAPPTSVNQNPGCTLDDFNYGSCSAYEWSHGTHCAGLVGAINNNNKGIASIGGGVTLMGVRCAENDGDMWSDDITRGVNWAAQQNANVINLSLGGGESSTSESQLMQTLYNNDIAVVAAAGNDGTQTQLYPAAYSTVLGVASTDNNKKLSSFSQYGSWVDIAAPGGYYNETSSYLNMLSTTYCTSQYFRITGTTTFNNKNYDGMQGTSMACPVAAGVVGLLKSKNPSATPAQIFNCLKSTSQSLASGSHTIASGSGIIDAQAALNCIGGSSTPNAAFTASPTSGNAPLSVQFTDQSTPGTGTITSRSWTFSGGSPASSTATNPSVVYSIPGTYNVSLTINTSGSQNDTETKNGYITVTQAGANFTLDFESSANFATNFSPWTTVDVDQSTTYGIEGIDFTGSGTALSFIAFNADATSPVTTGAEAHGGVRQGASFAATTPPNNDWLISPKVRPLNNTWKFKVWVRTYTDQYGLERFKIGVSTSGNQPANFTTFLTSGAHETAPTTWTLKEYSLTNYINQDIYIGINCVSDNAFIFFVDDISIGGSGSTEIDENADQSIHIYPNPAQNVLFINFEEESRKEALINIVDLNGRVVKTINNKNTNSGLSVDISNLSTGMYTMRFMFNDKIVVKKLSIVR